MSAGFPATFIPIIVTVAEKASERLFIASRTIAIELAIRPVAALNADNVRFTATPAQLVFIILFSLCDICVMLSYFLELIQSPITVNKALIINSS